MPEWTARKAIVNDLEAEGALVKIEDYSHNVGTCYRCGTTVEPRVSKQWFVKMAPLAQPAIDAVKNRKTKFVPERFDKIFYHWMENIKDWCISRQLWWGHRLPVWYCEDCGKYFSDADAKNEITKAATVIAKLTDDTKSPQTGDNSHMVLWFALLFVSCGGIITTIYIGKRKKKKSE